MNTAIIYSSKYGATRIYAEWIAKILQVPCLDVSSVKKSDLAAFDNLIIGSSVYIGRLRIRQWMKENLSGLLNKKIFLFIVCGTPSAEKEKWMKYAESSVPGELLRNCRLYNFPGRLNFRKLSPRDKFLLRFRAFLSSTPAERSLLLDGYDEVDKQEIEPLIADFMQTENQSIHPERTNPILIIQ